jgi:hypothetical protein
VKSGNFHVICNKKSLMRYCVASIDVDLMSNLAEKLEFGVTLSLRNFEMAFFFSF